MVLALTIGLARPSAHDSVPPPAVDVQLTPGAADLTVFVRMPIDVLSDANLPRDEKGLVTAVLEQPLLLIAEDVADGFEMEQGGRRLMPATTRASVAEGGSFITVELVYDLQSDAGSLSGRLRSFRSDRGAVPTVARFTPPQGTARTFTVTAGAERVIFNPTVLEAVRQFLPSGIAEVRGGWLFLLFALCLTGPFRRHGSRRNATLALVAGEVVASLASGAIGTGTTLLILAPSIAASAVVVAALQGVAGSRAHWLWPLALAFGLANGLALGRAFNDAASLAGSHVALTFVCVLLVVLAGQLWILVFLSSAIALGCRWGIPERTAAIAISIYAGHSALHRLDDSAALAAALAPLTADRFLTALALGWALIAIGVGAIETFRAGSPRELLGAHGGPAR